MSNLSILVIGFVVHAIFIIAIYDVYFTTKLVHGMTPHRSRIQPAAKRLVLFSLDGVRAESVFQLDENGNSYFPFFRKVIETKGVWGINDNVGTTYTEEGHLAMLVGTYQCMVEEVKRRYGYVEPYDSFLNETRHVWAMVHGVLYPMFDMEKLATAEQERTVKCSKYTYNCTQPLFERSKVDTELKRRLSEDQIVFFIQTPYTDGMGHNHNQASMTFKQAMPLVDDNMRRIAEMVDEYYGDDRTVFALTSDHGQGVQSDHGTNAELERLLPFIVWGAGVRGPLQNDDQHVYPDHFSEDWKLSHIRRQDIQMIDMAPLLAALLGVNFPMNSEGILPHEILSSGISEKAELMYANLRQLIALMERKMEVAQEHSLKVLFTYYSDLSPHGVREFHHRIKTLFSESKYQAVLDECTRLAPIAVNGIRYYQAYGRFFLRSVMVLGFIGWIVYMLSVSADDDSYRKRQLSRRLQMLVLAICGVTCIYIYVQALSWTVYIYCTTTICVWLLVYMGSNARIWMNLAAFPVRNNKISVVCGLEWLTLILITIYGCTDRYLLTFGFIIVGIGPIWFDGIKDDKMLKLTWLVLCVIVSIFPNVPTVMFPPADMNRCWLLVSGTFVCLSALAFILYTVKCKHEAAHRRSNIINVIQIVLLAAVSYIAGTTSYVSAHRLHYNVNMVQYNICWTILGCSPLWPLLDNGDIQRQLCTAMLSVFTAALMLSRSWDSVYYVCLIYLLVTWYWLDTKMAAGAINSGDKTSDKVTEEGRSSSISAAHGDSGRSQTQLLNIRRVVYTIFFAFASVFGRDTVMSLTGMTRSDATFCLSFNANTPQGYFLTSLQIMVPALFVLCVISAIAAKNKISLQHFLCTAYIICDIMTVIFLFLFYDVDHRYGWASSWIHYTLSALGVSFGALLLAAVRLLMSPNPRAFLRGGET